MRIDDAMKQFCNQCGYLLDDGEIVTCRDCLSLRHVPAGQIRINQTRVYTSDNGSGCSGCTFLDWCKANVWSGASLPCYPKDARYRRYVAQGKRGRSKAKGERVTA